MRDDLWVTPAFPRCKTIPRSMSTVLCGHLSRIRCDESVGVLTIGNSGIVDSHIAYPATQVSPQGYSLGHIVDSCCPARISDVHLFNTLRYKLQSKFTIAGEVSKRIAYLNPSAVTGNI